MRLPIKNVTVARLAALSTCSTQPSSSWLSFITLNLSRIWDLWNTASGTATLASSAEGMTPIAMPCPPSCASVISGASAPPMIGGEATACG